MFISFEGANMHVEDNETRTYTKRGRVNINPVHIGLFYDHTLVVDGMKIHVMEDEHEIRKRLNEQGHD